ncbi:MAG TPA: ribosome maturation factor RimP [Pedomonas sp.]
MVNIERLRELVEPIVTKMGYELVRISFSGGASNATLQVMAERPDTGQLVIDDCAAISRAISDMLDELDPIEGEYRLEVSSPGIDRPLTRAKDYQTWATHDARINTRTPVNGRKRHNGVLEGLDGEEVLFRGEKDQEAYRIPLADIDSAKLLLTDRLVNATVPEWREQVEAEAAAQAEERAARRAAGLKDPKPQKEKPLKGGKARGSKGKSPKGNKSWFAAVDAEEEAAATASRDVSSETDDN